METPPDAAPRRLVRVLLPWLLWSLLLGLWTFGLLWPDSHRVVAVLPVSGKFPFAKVFHVSAYAFLAATACLMPARRWGRLGVWLLLLCHGALTEFLQNYVNRDGNLIDVGLDATGILLGIALGTSLRYWRQGQRRGEA